MRIVHRGLAVLAAFSMILILLVTAAEAAIYIDYGFYKKEYVKYEVLDELDMEMDDVMDVTHEMMAYLHGRRDNLVVQTFVGGEQQEFFNDREKAHMVDVKNLFMAAIHIRYAAIALFILTMFVLVWMKADWKKLLAKCYIIEVIGFLLLSGGIGFLFAKDFNKYFFKFHEIFFDNDLWLLDPDTDLMIRMLPEGFFSDFLVRIGIFAGITILVFFVISIFVYKRENKK